MKRILILAAVLSAIHFALMAICYMLSFSKSIYRCDFGGEATLAKEVASSATELLMAPLYWLWTPWMSRNVPNIIENALFVGNSMIWGLAGSLLFIGAWGRLSRNYTG